MNSLLHSLFSPATWKANLSSLLVHGGALTVCFVWLAAPSEHTSFAGKRNAARIEISLEPVAQQTQTQPVSLERVEPLEITSPEPPQQAKARAISPQATHVRPEPPLPISVAQLTEAQLDVREAAPEISEPTPPRKQTATLAENQQLPVPRDPVPLERPETQTTVPQPAAAASVQEIAGLDNRTPPDFSANPPPAYPRQAIDARQQGTVLLELHVSATGQVERVELLRSSGHAILDRAAIEAVEQWQGQPAHEGGIAVGTVEELRIRFIL